MRGLKAMSYASLLVTLFFGTLSASALAFSVGEAIDGALRSNSENQLQENSLRHLKASPSCLPPSTLPSAPVAGTESVTLAGAWTSSETYNAVFWRQACDTSTSYLYLRITPAVGNPFICGSSFQAIVGGIQRKVKLTQSLGSTSSFCADLLVPSTFLVEQWNFEPQYDVNAAITLVYSGVSTQATATLPAKGAQGPTPPPSTTGTVEAVEYYHAGFDHYFITAESAEIAALDGGAFGGAWVRTGESFKVESAATTGTSQVCRFFSNSFSPKSSHFYTANVTECVDIRLKNPDWTFEGYAFNARTPDSAGNCGSDTKVYRLYNNGQGGAPNHRFTTSTSTRATMIQKGWVAEGYGEGVTFCSSTSNPADALTLASRLLGGTWSMTYQYGSTYTDKMTFTKVYRNTDLSSSVTYWIEGTVNSSSVVLVGYDAANDFYLGLWTFASRNENWYRFKFTGTNTVYGCYDYSLAGGGMNSCSALNGIRSPPQVLAPDDVPAEYAVDQDIRKQMHRYSTQ